MSDKPSDHYREWLRRKVWPFPKRVSEGADSVLPHVQEFLDSSKLAGKKEKTEEKPDVEKPGH